MPLSNSPSNPVNRRSTGVRPRVGSLDAEIRVAVILLIFMFGLTRAAGGCSMLGDFSDHGDGGLRLVQLSAGLETALGVQVQEQLVPTLIDQPIVDGDGLGIVGGRMAEKNT